MVTDIKIPELGENIESAEVLSVLVKAGQKIEKDQPIIELETDKATAEVPSETSGTVKEVLVKAGQSVKVGETILRLESAEEGEPSRVDSAPLPKPEVIVPSRNAATAAEEDDGASTPPPAHPRADRPVKRAPARRAEAKAKPPRAPEPLRLVDTPAPEEEETAAPPELGDPAPAAPSVRRLARELGIDIDQVPAGRSGRISEEDVKSYARRLIAGAQPEAPRIAPSRGDVPELPDFSHWGEVEREHAGKIRRVTADAVALSWNVIPHVTQFDRADITEVESWRKRMTERAEGSDSKVTITAITVKVLAAALKVFPKFNSSYDDRTEEIVYKKYVNIGVAVDTEHGLLVPVIHNADTKNILAIAAELTDLADRARSRKIQIEELQGGNINLSNLGGLGTTYFSPIVTWP
ncbi:MAG TPA: 2-oxo acid dehydrogenase subunit E2, partial [Candidatus Eisenbacteria bacterium]|nr:2-oxo acid dehydrogenase subunit E2 [Candidatus Eisenbacteria bacterium]